MPYADPKVRKNYYKAWRDRNKDYLREWNKTWRKRNKDYYNKRAALYHRRQMRKWRRRVFKLLGDQCQRCGFDDERALQLHHSNRDGKKHRGRKGSTVAYYRQLIREIKTDSSKIELLCANCHAIEHWIPDSEYTPGKSKRRLIAKEVRKIRDRYESGESIKSIADRLDVQRETIRNIVKRLSYAEIK